jgi:hypothetical protein
MSGGVNFNPGLGAAAAAAHMERKRKSSDEHKDRQAMPLEKGWIREIHVMELHGLTEEHEQVFLDIYKTLHETTFTALVFHKVRLEGLSEKVRGVPPLSFLMLIQKHSLLKTYLSAIKDAADNFPWLVRSQSPWERTVYDFEKSFTEHKKAQILGLQGLVARTDRERAQVIQLLIDNNQFRELLEYFIMN